MRKSKSIKGATSGSGTSAMDQAAQAATDALQQLAAAAETLTQAISQMTGTPGGAGQNPSAFYNATSALSAINQATSQVQSQGSTALQSPGIQSVMATANNWGSGYSPMMQNFLQNAGNPFVGDMQSHPNGQPALAVASGDQSVSAAVGIGIGTGPGAGNGGGGAGYGGSGGGAGYSNYGHYNGIVGKTVEGGIQLAGSSTTQLLNLQAQQIVNGRTDVMSAGTTWGSIIGGTFGLGVGFLTGNPVLGMAIGSGVGGGIGGVLTAGVQNSVNAIDAMQVLHGTIDQTRTHGLDATSMGMRQERFENMIKGLGAWANPGRKFGVYPFAVTSADIAEGWESVTEGMLLGGRNPFEKVSSRYWGPTAGQLLDIYDEYVKNGVITPNGSRIRVEGGGLEEASEAIERRALSRYHNRAKDFLKGVRQVYAEQPEVGDNTVDRIMKYGPIQAMEYDRLQNDQGSLPMDEGQYFGLSADVRRSGLLTRRASLQARGSGAAVSSVLEGELARIGSVPGGRDSTLYAETSAHLRDSRAKAFHDSDIEQFEIPFTKINSQLDRANVMPFSPANVLGLTMRQVGLERAEIGRIDAYTKQRRSRGELSEEEELSLTQRREGLLTAQAQQITALSDGFMQRLPAMMSGVPTRLQGRYTTESMAAANMAMMGIHHIRAFGAANGKELAAQDAMFDEVGAPRPGRGTSPTQNTSNAGNSDKILAVLQQIAGLLAGNRGGGRSYEQNGSAASQLSRTQLGGNQGGTGAN